jgi:hypothetical protein
MSLVSSRSLWLVSTRNSEAVEQRLSKGESKPTRGILLHSHTTGLLDYPTPFASFDEAASTRSVRMKRMKRMNLTPHVLVRVYVYTGTHSPLAFLR